MMPGANAVATQLIRQLYGIFGHQAILIAAHQRDWASATFSGARHSIDWLLPCGPIADAEPASIASLAEHQFNLPGQIVADCIGELGSLSIDDGERWWRAVRVELLTVAAD